MTIVDWAVDGRRAKSAERGARSATAEGRNTTGSGSLATDYRRNAFLRNEPIWGYSENRVDGNGGTGNGYAVVVAGFRATGS